MEDKDSFLVMVTRLEAPVEEAEPQAGDLRGTKTGLERESQRRVQRCACVVGDGAGSKGRGRSVRSVGGRSGATTGRAESESSATQEIKRRVTDVWNRTEKYAHGYVPNKRDEEGDA